MSMGCRVWVLWATKIRKIWGKKPDFFLFIPKVKYFNHHSFVIYHGISKSLVVLESPLYQLSIWHKD
jgi:hypothetical protein